MEMQGELVHYATLMNARNSIQTQDVHVHTSVYHNAGWSLTRMEWKSSQAVKSNFTCLCVLAQLLI